jgi:hypothetical protein
MLKQSEETIECKTKCSTSDVSFDFQAFEKKEYISFNIYHTGNAETVLELSGKIKEGKILNKTVDIEKQMSFVMDIGAATLSPKVIGISSILLSLPTLFIISRHNKNK